MSDVIETGSRRRRSRNERPRAEALGKKREIDRTKDELELGRFVGDKDRRPGPDAATPGAPESGEVVGPKRQKSDDVLKTDSSKRVKEVRIAAPLVVDETDMPSRPRAKRRSKKTTARDKAISSLGKPVVLAVLSVLLVLLTGATFLLMPRYDFLGDPLITDPAFDDGLSAWTQEGLITTNREDPATVVLESITPDTRTYLVRDIDLPDGETHLILRARVQGEEVETGPELWDSARIYLAQLDADGRPNWEEDHNLFNLNGTTDIRNYRQLFSMPAEIDTARLAIEMKNATGRLTVSHLELQIVDYKITFLIAVGTLLLAWSGLVVYTAIKTFKGIESPKIRLWLGVFCALSIVGLMLPGGTHDMSAGSIASWIGIDEIGIDMIGHGVVFTALSFLVRLGRPQDPLWLHVGVWVLIAIASEVLQLFTIGRDPSLEDLWVDGIGIVLGLALAELTRRMQEFRSA